MNFIGEVILNLSKKMVEHTIKFYSDNQMFTYQRAVEVLNNLQSNAQYLRVARKNRHIPNYNKLKDTVKYMLRSGITLEQLNKLSVIHIAGTKGKGSTCAFIESILKEHGYKTGLYTSPHLVTVRERLKINGKSIDELLFAHEFWTLYNILDEQKDNEYDMPSYFNFLTIMMFHVFLKASIDVAIIEVGIGGEYDCTNVVPAPICVGITALDFDHVALLGNTIEDIAYQKSGIFKENVPAFTQPQLPAAMNVLKKRALDKNCSLRVVPDILSYPFKSNPPKLGISADVQYFNSSLAIELAAEWLNNISKKNKNYNNSYHNHCNDFKSQHLDIEKTEKALEVCQWPGRTQIFRGKFIDYYLDGAHTVESMKVCVDWFGKCVKKLQTGKRILIFNATGDRHAGLLLDRLKPLNFDQAFFVPNIASKSLINPDNEDRPVFNTEVMNRCEMHCKIWNHNGHVLPTVNDALEEIENNYWLNKSDDHLNSNDKIQLLITGSLHLVGAALSILDPHLSMTTTY